MWGLGAVENCGAGNGTFCYKTFRQFTFKLCAFPSLNINSHYF